VLSTSLIFSSFLQIYSALYPESTEFSTIHPPSVCAWAVGRWPNKTYQAHRDLPTHPCNQIIEGWKWVSSTSTFWISLDQPKNRIPKLALAKHATTEMGVLFIIMWISSSLLIQRFLLVNTISLIQKLYSNPNLAPDSLNLNQLICRRAVVLEFKKVHVERACGW